MDKKLFVDKFHFSIIILEMHPGFHSSIKRDGLTVSTCTSMFTDTDMTRASTLWISETAILLLGNYSTERWGKEKKKASFSFEFPLPYYSTYQHMRGIQ